jgi:hypothetical protein
MPNKKKLSEAHGTHQPFLQTYKAGERRCPQNNLFVNRKNGGSKEPPLGR